jgi:alanine-synthesizing transaminase
VLVAPGVSFNVPYRTHFRITNLPDSAVLRTVFSRIEEVLAGYAAAPRGGTVPNVVRADKRFG